MRILCASLLLALAFAACGKKELTPEERLQGRWVINNVNELQPNFGSVAIQNAAMEFDEDGTMRTKWGKTEERAKWVLNGEKTHIYIKGDSIHANGLHYNDTLAFTLADERTLHIINQGRKFEFKK